MNPFDLPNELRTAIDMEPMDFAVKTKRKHGFKDTAMFLFFGGIWTIFTSFFIAIFFGPLFFGNEVHFDLNGVPTTASWDNLEPLFFPAVFLGFFMLIGLVFIIVGLVRMLSPGGYFVGTETRLISYRNGNLNSIDWEQFNGNIRMKNRNGFGNLILELRTGRSGDKGRYIPNKVQMIGINDVGKIEQKCRIRIKENDPTPARS